MTACAHLSTRPQPMLKPGCYCTHCGTDLAPLTPNETALLAKLTKTRPSHPRAVQLRAKAASWDAYVTRNGVPRG